MVIEPLETVATEAAEAATEAAAPLMEQLAPMYDAVVVSCNLSVLGICAFGFVAGILLGAALWRWLK